MSAAALRKEPSIDGSGNRLPQFPRSPLHEQEPEASRKSSRHSAVPLKKADGQLDVPFLIPPLCTSWHENIVPRRIPDSQAENPTHRRSPGNVVVLSADKTLAEYLQTALHRAGYATFWATTASHVLVISRQLTPFLVLVDCRIRGWPLIWTEPTLRHVLVVAVIPPDCSYPEDRCIEDLACGIDGFHHVKDSLRLLITTVDAYLRRLEGNVPRRGFYRVGGVELDADAHDLHIAGQPVRLSAKPFAILKALMQSYPAVCRRDELLSRIWGPGFAIGPRVLDAHVHVIRRLLAQHPESRCRVVTVCKVGFKLEIGRAKQAFFSHSASKLIRLHRWRSWLCAPTSGPGSHGRGPIMSVTKILLRPADGDRRSGSLAKHSVTIDLIEGGTSCATLFVGSSSRS